MTGAWVAKTSKTFWRRSESSTWRYRSSVMLDFGVTEIVTDDFDRHVGAQRERRVTVAQVVQADAWQNRAATDHFLERVAVSDLHAMQRPVWACCGSPRVAPIDHALE